MIILIKMIVMIVEIVAMIFSLDSFMNKLVKIQSIININHHSLLLEI